MALQRLIDQHRARRIIESMVRDGRLPHAMLFWGPPGTGKSAAAIELARWLNCEQAPSGPCGQCEDCVRFGRLEHPHFSYQIPLPGKALVDSDSGDLTDAGAAQLAEIFSQKGENPYRSAEYSGGQFILIGQIRHLLQWANLRSFTDKPRVALIDHADRLREEAGNALLKLLEEPPPNFFLILTAETPEDILPTLRSRCLLIEFSRLKPETIREQLYTSGYQDDAENSRIARLSGGNLTRALEFAGEPEKTMMLYDLAINIVRHALGRNPLEFDQQLEKWDKQDLQDQMLVLEIIAAWLRDAAMLKETGLEDQPGIINSDRIELLKKFVQNCPNADFIDAVKNVEEARRNLETNALASLTLIMLARRLHKSVYQKDPV
ncbi:MAG: AAA family ATPase [bacterium]|nr:AAA family ATPase [bacterium]